MNEADILTAVRELADAIHDQRVAERAQSEAHIAMNKADRAASEAYGRTEEARRRLMELAGDLSVDPWAWYVAPATLLRKSES